MTLEPVMLRVSAPPSIELNVAYWRSLGLLRVVSRLSLRSKADAHWNVC